MLTEEFVVKLTELKLQYSFSVFGRPHRMNPLALGIGLLSFIGIVSDYFLMLSLVESTLSYFVVSVMDVLFHTTIITFNIIHLIDFYDSKTIYRIVRDIDTQLNTSMMQEKDWTLTAFIAVFSIMIMLTWAAMPMAETNLMDLIITLPSCDILLWAILKCLIVKRLRHIRTAEEFMDRTEDVISYTRQLLELNGKLNKAHGSLAWSYALTTFMVVIGTNFSVYVLFLAGQESNLMKKEYVPYAFMITVLYLFTAILMVSWSSNIVEEVDEIKFELDITMTARPCTEKQRKLISLFLMELHHSNVELSAVGLFDITKLSFSSACATAISYVLVLIQFI